MTSPVASNHPADRAGLATPSPAERADERSFRMLLDAQSAAASTPFAPFAAGGVQSAASPAVSDAGSARLDRASPRQGQRRQRK